MHTWKIASNSIPVVPALVRRERIGTSLVAAAESESSITDKLNLYMIVYYEGSSEAQTANVSERRESEAGSEVS